MEVKPLKIKTMNNRFPRVCFFIGGLNHARSQGMHPAKGFKALFERAVSKFLSIYFIEALKLAFQIMSQVRGFNERGGTMESNQKLMFQLPVAQKRV